MWDPSTPFYDQSVGINNYPRPGMDHAGPGWGQRGLRSDLVTLCICPHLLPCKRPSASWCARQHGVSRQRASRLQQEFARELGANIQFRGQRFLKRANA